LESKWKKAETKIELPGNELIAAPRLDRNRAPGSRSSNCCGHRDYCHSRRHVAAPLEPALGQGQRTVCLNNLRQIGLFVQFYTDETTIFFLRIEIKA